MNSVRIVADSGCDLSPALAEEFKITIIPVFVRFGQEMVPSDHLTNDEFWQRAVNSGEPPGTSSPAPGTFMQAFQNLKSAAKAGCWTSKVCTEDGHQETPALQPCGNAAIQRMALSKMTARGVGGSCVPPRSDSWLPVSTMVTSRVVLAWPSRSVWLQRP